MADFFPMDQRPDYLKNRNNLGNMTVGEAIQLKEKLDAKNAKEHLGEEVFSKDGKPQSIRYKEQSDNSVSKFHPARFNRQPLTHPKNFYKHIPKKRETIVRNFPMDHLGLTGQVPDTVLGKMHNRTVKVTLDMFCKATHKDARGQSKAGKYSDQHQLRAGLINYCMALMQLWPNDYSGLVILKVLEDELWAGGVTSDDKKKAEIVTEFFNAVVEDNCGKAVHDSYPLVYEQVRTGYQ